MDRGSKAKRRAEEANAAQTLRLKRPASLSIALMRADAAQEQGFRSLAMAPPIASDRASGHGIGEVRDRAARALGHDAVPAHERQRAARRHNEAPREVLNRPPDLTDSVDGHRGALAAHARHTCLPEPHDLSDRRNPVAVYKEQHVRPRRSDVTARRQVDRDPVDRLREGQRHQTLALVERMRH